MRVREGLLVLADGTHVRGRGHRGRAARRGRHRRGRVQHGAVAATRRSSPTRPTPGRSSPSPTPTSATTGPTPTTTRPPGPSAGAWWCATWPAAARNWRADRGPRRLPRAATACPASPGSTPGASPATSATPAPCPAPSAPPTRCTLKAAALAEPGTDGVDLVAEVTCAEPYTVGRRPGGRRRAGGGLRLRHQAHDPAPPRRASPTVDGGAGAARPAAEVLAREPDGVFLSNGPGDPAAVALRHRRHRRQLLGEVPVFGICLGHQLLGTALGGRHLQAALRPPRRQPPGAPPGHRHGRDHQPEPQLRRGRGLARPAARSPT